MQEIREHKTMSTWWSQTCGHVSTIFQLAPCGRRPPSQANSFTQRRTTRMKKRKTNYHQKIQPRYEASSGKKSGGNGTGLKKLKCLKHFGEMKEKLQLISCSFRPQRGRAQQKRWTEEHRKETVLLQLLKKVSYWGGPFQWLQFCDKFQLPFLKLLFSRSIFESKTK